MIRMIKAFWKVVIAVLLVTILPASSFADTPTAQVPGNAQAATTPAFEDIHYTEVQSLTDGGKYYVFYIDGIKNTLVKPQKVLALSMPLMSSLQDTIFRLDRKIKGGADRNLDSKRDRRMSVCIQERNA